MKKVFMGMFALATMLLATSCSEDEIVAQSSGNEVTVSFTAQLRSDVKTKAVGNDTDNVDKLVFAVYDEEGDELSDLRQELGANDLTSDGNKKKATINVVLVKGQTYSFAFWAQKKDHAAYTFDPKTATVTVDYSSANDRSADAFFAAKNNYTVNGSFEETMTLKRPFAQVNFLTTGDDLTNAGKAGLDPLTLSSSIVVENAATQLNVLTGKVAEPTKAEFDLASLITVVNEDDKKSLESTTITGVEGTYYYLATAYFLATEAVDPVDFTTTMTIQSSEEQKGAITLTVPNITAQRNYRTNIYGNLLTSNGKFNVLVDPNFNDPDNNISTNGGATSTYGDINTLLSENAESTGALIYNVNVEENAEKESAVTITIPDATQATSLTFNLEDLAANATVTIQNEDQDTDSYTGSVVVVVPEGVDLGKLTINMPDAHVTLQNGSYSEVDAITSNTTLEIGEGTAIETLTVNQGNVRIATSGSVNTITNNTNGTLYVLMAGGEWTGLSSNTDTKTIVIYEDTEHEVALNGKYSTESFANLLSYNADVLKLTELSFDVAAGTYSEVVNVTGGKTITIQPCKEGEEVVIAGIAHESDGNPSTVVVNNITIDNTLQSEGWFTGTSPNIKPCVGAWGGYLTFNNCIFTVSGSSGAETGVMTWWTTDLMTLDFTKCTFNGYNDHESARAMQIYGNVNLNVTECTVNTKKDYSLKYVGSTNCTATFTKNTVTNTEYFVELGSTVYPGSNYTVIFNNSILGEGISNYVVANEENQTIIVDGKQLVADGISLNTTTGEYEISSAAGFKYFAETILTASSDNEVTGKLVENIDLKDVKWPAIVTKTPFVLDGNDKTISNLTASEVTSDGFYNFAMFNVTYKSTTIKNLTVEGATVSGNGQSNSHGSVLVATPREMLTVSKVTVKNSTVSNCDRSSMIVTYLYFDSADIDDCVVEGCTINSIGTAGAILGLNNNHNITIDNCQVNSTTVSSSEGSNKAGIFIGTWQDDTYAVPALTGCTTTNSKAINADTETNNNIGRTV